MLLKTPWKTEFLEFVKRSVGHNITVVANTSVQAGDVVSPENLNKGISEGEKVVDKVVSGVVEGWRNQ